ncbi:uncharacterized protein [Mobula birostris]|uniref:uncharacterized protein isoform X4 n=1 Tax=Mobula birostris TaxID=1983395 RepID=UPI003B284984
MRHLPCSVFSKCSVHWVQPTLGFYWKSFTNTTAGFISQRRRFIYCDLKIFNILKTIIRKSEKRVAEKTKLTSERKLQKEMSNPIRLYKRPIKSQGQLRVADDLLATSKHPPSGVPESRTNMHTTIPHLPKINSAVVQENDVKEQQVPISHIADYFMARKKTLKLNGFHWQREYVPIPSNLPLAIRGYRTGNRDNMTHKEKCIGNRKGRKSGLSETCTTRKNMQSSAEGSAGTDSNNTGLDSSEAEDSPPLRQYNGPLITKFQTQARTKMAARFQGGLGYAVDGGRSLNVKSVKSANIANSSSDSVARMKWTKSFVRKAVNRQQRPSATSLAEKGNTRTELEQDCCANGFTLDLELKHRPVSPAANCNVPTGSDMLCFDDNCVHNLENVNGEKRDDPAAELISKTTFQNPDGHNFFPVTPNCERYEGKMKQVIKEPVSKHQQIKASSSVVTSLSKSSVKSRSNKISGKTACCSAVSKYSDKDSKVSSGASEDGGSEEHTFDLNQILQERGASICANTRVLLKCGVGHHNQKQPLKSSLKKSLDWRAHSQTTTVHLPKTGEQWSAPCVNQTLDRSMKACLRTRLEPLHRSLNQTAQDFVCSVPEESTEFCTKFGYDQKQYRKLRQHCHQPSNHCRGNVCNLGLQTATQQRLERLCYYGTVEQGFGRDRDMNANANTHSNQFCQRENHTFQPNDEPQHLQFPQPRDLIWCKSPSAKRTVELYSSHGDEVPKITMTCPTPIPCRTPS